MTEHPEELALDRHLVGELDGTEREQLERHLRDCSACRDRHQSFAQMRGSFPTDYPFSVVTSRFAESTNDLARARARTRRVRRWMLGPAVAAAAVMVLVFVWARRGTRDDEALGTRTKGQAVAVAWYVGRDGAATQLWPGQPLWTSDRLQAVVSTPTTGFLSVISIDGAGRTSVYVPSDPGTAFRVPAGVDQSLPFATELDDSIGTEHLFVVFCTEPFVPAELAALARSRSLAGIHRDGCSIAEHTFDKIAKPVRAP